MGWSGTYLYKPVSMSDVKSAIGSSSNDLATLCTSTAINMWAKYKPIYHSGVGALTNAQFAEDLGGQSGYRIKYGIKRPNSYGVTDLVQSGVIQNRPWTYNRPSGGTNSPYRLSDFVSSENSYGYSIRAICPIRMQLSTSDGFLPVPTQSNDGATLSFYFLFGPASNFPPNRVWLKEHSIDVSELFSSSELNYYPTILLNYKEGNVIKQYYKSEDNNLSTIFNSRNYVGRVEINTKTFRDVIGEGSWFNEGEEWSIVFFLSQYKIPGTAASHDLNSGNITRLQYEGTKVLGSPDFFLAHVRRTTWVDDMVSLKATITITKRSGYTNQYYVSSVTVQYNTRVSRTLSVTVKYTMPAQNNTGQNLGYIQSGNGTPLPAPDNRILTHEVTTSMAMQGATTNNITNSDMTTPNFVYTNSFPNNVQPIGLDIYFEYGGYRISRGTTVDCHAISSSSSTTLTLVGS